MSGEFIPARMNVRRDPVDSAFLERYAKRLEGRAKWLAALYVLWGGFIGFGLGSALVAIFAWAQMFRGGGINLAALLGQQPQPVVEPMLYGIPLVWIPLVMAGIGAVLWGGKGVGKSEDLRFQAQMALHLIRLQDLVKEQSST
ncbi:MAG: hypothetical protein EON60_13070 [Alphaproteobacteria bacterium]|nr:MAG: hypothetical protein EON60_13070 [Alphaproteobacteria bacterium]